MPLVPPAATPVIDQTSIPANDSTHPSLAPPGTDAELTGPFVPTSHASLGRIGRYELIRELGRGAFGTVFLGHDPELDRPVAIKVLHSHRAENNVNTERFVREARSAANLRHPHLIAVLDAGTDGTNCYIVTAYLSGGTLLDRLRDRPVSINEAVATLAQIADGAHFAHENGIVHRDIKPANLMFDEHGRAQIVDFGLARRTGVGSELTLEGQVVGTPAYMPPEQARGEPVDARSDIYALGATLYHLLAGRAPYTGAATKVLHDILSGPAPSVRTWNRTVPRDLANICARAMSHDPAERYLTARDLRDDLDRFTRGEAVHARPIGPLLRLWRWSNRSPTVAILTASVVLISLIGAGLFAWKYREANNNFERAQERRREAVQNHLSGEQRADAARKLIGEVVRSMLVDGAEPITLQALAPEVLSAAAQQFEMALSDPSAVRDNSAKADLYSSLATVRRIQRDGPAAEIAARKALDLREPTTTAVSQDHLAIAYARANQRDVVGAREAFHAARIAAEQAGVRSPSPAVSLVLVQAATGEARTYLTGSMKSPARAVEVITLARQSADELASTREGGIQAQSVLADYFWVFGSTLLADKRERDAVTPLRQAIVYFGELNAQAPTIEHFQFGLAWSSQSLANALTSTGENAQSVRGIAIEAFGKIIRHQQALLRGMPGNLRALRSLGVAANNRGSTRADDNQFDAGADFRLAADAMRRCHQLSGEHGDLHGARDALRNLFKCEMREDKWAAAMNTLRERESLAGSDLGERYHLWLDASRLADATQSSAPEIARQAQSIGQSPKDGNTGSVLGRMVRRALATWSSQ